MSDLKRPDVLDSISDAELSELELRADEKNKAEFRTIAESYGWDGKTIDEVYEWLGQAKGYEGFEE